jgi:hypothetical protein
MAEKNVHVAPDKDSMFRFVPWFVILDKFGSFNFLIYKWGIIIKLRQSENMGDNGMECML